MVPGKKFPRLFVWLGVVLLQFIMTQIVTLLASFLIPDIESFQQAHGALFVVFLGITFSTGVFLAGWLALKRGWLIAKPKYLARLATTLLGAYLPLIVALILYHALEPGNPFFFISILAAVLGFYLPGWAERNATVRLPEG